MLALKLHLTRIDELNLQKAEQDSLRIQAKLRKVAEQSERRRKGKGRESRRLRAKPTIGSPYSVGMRQRQTSSRMARIAFAAVPR
jgi:hypothetical protein